MSDFDLRLLSGTSLNSPDRYPAWKVTRNSAVALGAIALGVTGVFWAASEIDKARASSEERERGGRAS